MRLAEDTRARVPFALVGVVLLVSSAAFATSLETRGPAETNAASRAAEEATAVARTAVHRAVTRASREAAADPLVAPANTSVGSVINDSAPFTDYLRVRIYLAASDTLSRATANVGDASAAVELPPVTGAETLRRAKQRIDIERIPGDNERIAVTVRGATVAVRRNGRVVHRREYAPTVTVETPVLALHERMEAFEGRLTESATQGGLAARVTGRLAAVAWVRGLAQYGGAPIGNVLATRHVEVTTNGALLDTQHRTLGRSDRAGRRAHGRAAQRTALTDLLEAVVGAEWTETVLGPTGGAVADTTLRMAGRGAIERSRLGLSVGVNRSADEAFLEAVDGNVIEAAIGEVYTAEAWRRVRTRRHGRSTTGTVAPEGNGWRLVGTTNTTRVTVTPANGSRPPTPDGRHVLASRARTVTVTERVVRTWQRDGHAVRTVARTRTRHRVDVAVVGQHATDEHAPDRDIRAPHRPGGPLDGRNFAGVRRRAVDRLIEGGSDVDDLARRAVLGSVPERHVTLEVAPPPGLWGWVYRDLATLRERTRAISVAVDRREALVGTPTDRLLAAVRERRQELLDTPATYPSVAAKVRTSARARYLEALEARIDARARNSHAFHDRLADELAAHGLSFERLFGERNASPVTGPETVVTAVEGEPPYLTTTVVTPDHTEAVDGSYHPLVTRNRNLFAVPSWSGTADIGLGEGGAGLAAAGHALRAANATLGASGNATLERRRDRLAARTAGALGLVRARLRGALLESGAVDRRAVARRVVAAGFDRWPTIDGRARAAADGSLAEAVAEEAVGGGVGDPKRDRIRVRLRLALAEAVPHATVEGEAVIAVGNATSELARRAIARGGESALDEWVGPALRPPMSGLPLVPVPGWWYATLNVWTVTVRGRYARFAIRAPTGAPGRNRSYVRRRATVAVDVDDDGRSELLGRNRPVAFTIETAVPVVVPPGAPGVGDGERDERSPGWPSPGRK